MVIGFIFSTLVVHSGSVRSALSAYDEFRLIHRSSENSQDNVGYAARWALFKERKAEVRAHNAGKHSWKKALNRFSDFTHNEMQSMMGYKRVGGRWASESSGTSSFLQTDNDEDDIVDVSSLARTVDWTSKMNVSNFVHDQGACGSCWAHAAVAALEAHAELTHGSTSLLAVQEIIDCTANPQHCGGTGGCHGATVELAFEHVQKYGILPQNAYKKGCPTEFQPNALNIQGFVRLPENKASHLLRALNQGVVGVSVDASNLHSYGSGVFSGCQPDTIVNHAVLGVGYGVDSRSGKKYWHIKNSWSDTWGENGYFRIERHDDDDAYCGIDTKPEAGVYCEKHPASVPVCGMCGITSDSAYPVMLPHRTNLRQADISRTNVLRVQ